MLTSSSLVNHIISNLAPPRQAPPATATQSVLAPSTTPPVVRAPESAPPLSISELIAEQAAVEEHESEADRADRMEVDVINLLAASAPRGPLDDSNMPSHEDSVMYDSSDTAIHQSVPDSESAASGSDSSSTIGPQVDELPPITQYQQPSGPIITPTAEVQPVFFAADPMISAPLGPVLKQQATTSEVMMDVSLIRTGIANDSSSAVVIQSEGSSSSPSSSSVPEVALGASGFPAPSVEMVANV